METDFLKEIERIFNRQATRCKEELNQVNCPEIYINCFSKYFKFCKFDVLNIINNKNKGIVYGNRGNKE